MASNRIRKNFKVKADQLNVWVNECEDKTFIHFRQKSTDKDEPKKNYLFIGVAHIPDLQLCALRAADFEFQCAIIDSRETDDGDTYVVELVRIETDKEQKNGHHHYYQLQSRNVEFEKPFRFVKFTDIHGFQEVLAGANEASSKMFFKKERQNVLKRQNGRPNDKSLLNLKVPENDQANHAVVVKRQNKCPIDKSPKQLKENDSTEKLPRFVSQTLTGINDPYADVFNDHMPFMPYDDEMTRSRFPESYKPRRAKMLI